MRIAQIVGLGLFASCARFGASPDPSADAGVFAEDSGGGVTSDAGDSRAGAHFCDGKNEASGYRLCADFDDGTVAPSVFGSTTPAKLLGNVVDIAPYDGNPALRVRVTDPLPNAATYFAARTLAMRDQSTIALTVRTLAAPGAHAFVDFCEISSDDSVNFSLHLAYDGDSQGIILEQTMPTSTTPDTVLASFDALVGSVHRFVVTLDFRAATATVSRDGEVAKSGTLKPPFPTTELRLSVGLADHNDNATGSYALDDITVR